MKVVWPDNWDSDFNFYDFYSVETISVSEDEEPEFLQSSILGPDGKPVNYEFPSVKQGYIGFIPPEFLEALNRPKRKRRRKNARVE